MTDEQRKQDAGLQTRLSLYLFDFAAELLDKPKFAAEMLDMQKKVQIPLPPETLVRVSRAIEQIMDIFGYDTHKMH
jgi:hypothetical protein